MSASSSPSPSSPNPALAPSSAEEDEALARMFARMDAHSTAPGGSASVSTGPAGQAGAGDPADNEGSDVDEVWEDAAEDLESDGDEGEEWNMERLESALEKADALKQRANAEFSPGQAFHQAITTYMSALACLPARAPGAGDKGKGKGRALEGDDGVRIEEVDEEEAARIERGEDANARRQREAEERCTTLRAVLWANLAAVYLKLGQNKEAVESSTEALKDNPEHVKALLRRSTANMNINSWSSLQSAQDDLQAVLPLLPSDSPLRAHAQKNLRDLPARIAQRAEEEKGEMLGKLKELGNSLLGNFGLSTDNFKFEPNGQGGYGMSFVR